MPVNNIIIEGYPQYHFEGGKLYRNKYITKNLQFRCKREIKLTKKGQVYGYYLVRYNKRKFVSLKELKWRTNDKNKISKGSI